MSLTPDFQLSAPTFQDSVRRPSEKRPVGLSAAAPSESGVGTSSGIDAFESRGTCGRPAPTCAGEKGNDWGAGDSDELVVSSPWGSGRGEPWICDSSSFRAFVGVNGVLGVDPGCTSPDRYDECGERLCWLKPRDQEEGTGRLRTGELVFARVGSLAADDSDGACSSRMD